MLLTAGMIGVDMGTHTEPKLACMLQEQER